MNPVTATTRWLASAGKDLLFVWLFVVVAAFWSATHGQGGTAPPAAMEWLFGVGFATSLTSWALKDARQHGIRGCYDFDTFVFYTWTLFVPIYLLRTRGVRAFATLGLFLLLVSSASIVGTVLAIPFERVH